MPRSSRIREALERRQQEMESDDRRSRLIFIAIVAAFAIAIAGIMIKRKLDSGPVDLNTANIEKLDTLPGIGPETAKEIIKNRPYERVEDLDEVKGIGPATIEKIRDRVKISD